ncbi:hypothetical protein MTP03_44460 [Tsukamurella sp. PLM1]|nr:hypothetical protein MTP03_44460 [Tsukamurella sp. PLM1]
MTPQEDLDAALTLEALCDVVSGGAPSMDALLMRKAELIVEKAETWEERQRELAGLTDAGDAAWNADEEVEVR